jgi:hypothetical protein
LLEYVGSDEENAAKVRLEDAMVSDYVGKEVTKNDA